MKYESQVLRAEMQRPPILTDRERQIVPFLAVGSSRAEMAEHFKISAETIKVHVRNILNKFEASSFRDGAEAIGLYSEYYCGSNPAYNLFCISVNAHAVIDPAKGMMTSRVRSLYVGIREQTDSIISTVTHGMFKVVSVKIDGVVSTPKEHYTNTDVHERIYNPPIPPNVEFVREFEVVRSLGDDPYKNSSYVLSINYPTDELSLSVEFVGERQPKQFRAATLIGAMERKTEPPPVVKTAENQYVINTNVTKVGANYSINWEW